METNPRVEDLEWHNIPTAILPSGPQAAFVASAVDPATSLAKPTVQASVLGLDGKDVT